MQVSISTGSPTLEDADDLAAMFRLLGDPTRVRILFCLLHEEDRRVGDIAECLDVSETKVSQALRLLRGAGIVRNRRDGRAVHYRLDDDHVRQLLVVMRDHAAHEPGGRE